jgi:CRP-like cAMP-binding protein
MRKDFQRDFENAISSEDIAAICERPGKERSRYQRQAVKEFMLKVPDLNWGGSRVIDDVCNNLTTRYFEAGEALMVKGEVPDCMYVIVEGSIGIYVDNDRLLYQIQKCNAVGELSLKLKTRRTATVRAIEYVKALRFSLEDYDYLMHRSSLFQRIEISKSIRQVDFFKSWFQGKLELLASKVLVQTFGAGQVIYKAGDSAVNMFILKTGSVKLEVYVELERRNRWPKTQKSWETCLTRKEYRQTVRIVRSLEIFGEKELLREKPRVAQATSQETSVVYVLDRSIIKEVFSESELRALELNNPENPPTPVIQSIISSDNLQESTRVRALLDSFGVNPTPTGRDSTSPSRMCKMQKLAKSMRRRSRMRSEVVKKTVVLLDN